VIAPVETVPRRHLFERRRRAIAALAMRKTGFRSVQRQAREHGVSTGWFGRGRIGRDRFRAETPRSNSMLAKAESLPLRSFRLLRSRGIGRQPGLATWPRPHTEPDALGPPRHTTQAVRRRAAGRKHHRRRIAPCRKHQDRPAFRRDRNGYVQLATHRRRRAGPGEMRQASRRRSPLLRSFVCPGEGAPDPAWSKRRRRHRRSASGEYRGAGPTRRPPMRDAPGPEARRSGARITIRKRLLLAHVFQRPDAFLFRPQPRTGAGVDR